MAAVLVVEDEPLVRSVISIRLKHEGFEIIEACGADEAIAVLESGRDVYLIFTDVDMPGSMDGLEFATIVRSEWPRIEIILTSGRHSPTVLPERAEFISKPYKAAHIVSKIREAACKIIDQDVLIRSK
jgi:CheY-like chemotaxis protein